MAHSSPRSTTADYHEDDYKHFHDSHVTSASHDGGPGGGGATDSNTAAALPAAPKTSKASASKEALAELQLQNAVLTEPLAMAAVFVSACLHATAFALAATLTQHFTLDLIIHTEVCAAAAYVWDIICAVVLGVIPFSRARHAKDILLHHVPILVVVGLSLPHYTSPKAAVAMTPHLARSVSYGFLSCLNESIMCMQRLGFAVSFPAVVLEYS